MRKRQEPLARQHQYAEPLDQVGYDVTAKIRNWKFPDHSHAAKFNSWYPNTFFTLVSFFFFFFWGVVPTFTTVRRYQTNTRSVCLTLRTHSMERANVLLRKTDQLTNAVENTQAPAQLARVAVRRRQTNHTINS